MKLWQKKEQELDPLIEEFTVGDDFILDGRLVKYDCLASKAHAYVLHRAGILTRGELGDLDLALDDILSLDEKGNFVISRSDEDCHTAIENYLTEKLGDVGKKIHTGRSRNDQVLTALRLYEKDALSEIRKLLEDFGKRLDVAIGDSGGIALPGYTHMRKAMPTTVAMWLGSFLELIEADKSLVKNTAQIIDKCPLGTAAGFGVPVLDLDRGCSADELGFGALLENPIAAQASRGKFEAIVLGVCTQIMFTLNKLASDLMLFSTSEFGFLELDSSVCTGSSIMPQKKNPDVLELIRAKYHVVLAEEIKIKSLIGNLISGYNRDLQLTKGPLFCGLDTVKACLKAASIALKGIKFDKSACKKALTVELYATKSAYELVKKGTPFREAYRIVAQKKY